MRCPMCGFDRRSADRTVRGRVGAICRRCAFLAATYFTQTRDENGVLFPVDSWIDYETLDLLSLSEKALTFAAAAN